MKIYIAGKITGLAPEDIRRKFRTAATRLTKQGHTVFEPSVLPPYDNVSHEDYMHICYAMIDICEAVYVLADWQTSKGARLEVQYASDWRKKIIYEDGSTAEPDFPLVHQCQ